MSQLIYRQVSLPLEVFEYIKQTQRKLNVTEDRAFNNSEVIARIVLEHMNNNVETVEGINKSEYKEEVHNG